MQVEELARDGRIGVIEAVGGKLLLLGKPHFAVAAVSRPAHIEDVVHVLQVCGDAVQSVSQLDGHRIEIDAAALLEVSELGDLQSIEQDLPADSPGAQRRRFPVVFLEANVVLGRADADRSKALRDTGPGCRPGAGFKIT